MLPPANDLLPRVPTNDTNLGGVMIPKDSLVSVDIHALHHNPHVWKNPKEFIPERFEEGGEHSKHKGLTYMPFGSGSRTCIGVNFSTMEQRVALSMLCKCLVLEEGRRELGSGRTNEKSLLLYEYYFFFLVY